MKIPYLAFLLNDSWSLQEYMHGQVPNVKDVMRRVFNLQRGQDIMMPDYCFHLDWQEEMLRSNCQNSCSLSLFLPAAISYLSKRYLFMLKGKLYVKKEMAEEWMEVVRVFPPLLLEAAFFLDDELFEDNEKDFFKEVLVPNFRESAIRIPYHRNMEKLVQEENGLCDLHVHINGTSETDYLWWSQIGFVDKWIESMRESWENLLVNTQREQLTDADLKELIDSLRKSKGLFQKVLEDIGQMDGAQMLFTQYYEYLHPSDLERTPVLALGAYFYLKVLSLMRAEKLRTSTVHDFHYFLLVLGWVHRMMVQQYNQKGFSQFQMVTENGFRWNHERKNYKARFTQLSKNDGLSILGYMEGRFSPKDSLLGNLALVNGIKEGYEELLRENRNLELQLIAHFIKKRDKSPVDAWWRHNELRKEVMRKATALKNLDDYWAYKFHKQAFVGIDAAASEMDAGPEVFAPVFKWLRKEWKRNRKNLRFTYHAGEDFVHLLSGLRNMVEALDFLEMEQGDRIGHGTAAGIDPKLWIARMPHVFKMERGEWLDDLVMTYSLITEPFNHDAELNGILPRIQADIKDLHRDIFGDDYCMNDILLAWRLRAYEPKTLLRDQINKFGVQKTVLEKQGKINDNSLLLYEDYHINKKVKEKYHSLYIVDLEKSYFTAGIYRKLQNLVLHKIASKGVAIEVLFTSNTAISFYRDSEEHHLARWLEDCSEENLLIPPVVVGSDDPGIFMTNIYTEYVRIANYLEKHSYGFNARIRILKDLIHSSKYYSFNN